MKSLPFSHLKRLHQAADYKRLFATTDRLASKHWVFIAAKNHLIYARLGLVVPKKHYTKAVSRNRIKRLIRESFRHKQHDLQGLDIVVLALKNIEVLSNIQISQSLNQQWERLVLRKSAL